MDLTRLQGTAAPAAMPPQTSADPARAAAAGRAVRAAAAGGGTIEERRESLRHAAKEFEAIFVNQMISAMRKTVSDGGLMRKNQGEKIFESMLDQEWSKKLTARGGHNSLSELLYRQLSRDAGLEEGSPTAAPDEMVPLERNSEFADLNRQVGSDPVRLDASGAKPFGVPGTVKERQ